MAFRLEPQEAQTALWKKLEKHFEERLEMLRKKNDSDKGERETAMLRGKIAECKNFLALGNPQQPGSASDDDFSPSDW